MCDGVAQQRHIQIYIVYQISRNVSYLVDMWLLMKLTGCWTWDLRNQLRTSLKNHTTLVSKQTHPNRN